MSLFTVACCDEILVTLVFCVVFSLLCSFLSLYQMITTGFGCVEFMEISTSVHPKALFFVNKCLVNSYLSLLNDFTVIFEFICCRNPKISTDGYKVWDHIHFICHSNRWHHFLVQWKLFVVYPLWKWCLRLLRHTFHKFIFLRDITWLLLGDLVRLAIYVGPSLNSHTRIC